MTGLSIVAPAFNEEECIEASVRSWAALFEPLGVDGEIIVANDGSTDRTGEVLDRIARELACVRVLHLPGNLGYGGALRAAIGAARGDWVVTIDSDGQFDPDDIQRLISHRERCRCDVVNGRRRRKQDSWSRFAADRGLAQLVQTLFQLPLSDPNCALKLVRRSWLQSIRLRNHGFALPTELVVRAAHAGLTIEELEVNHRERAAGTTKLHLWRAGAGMMRFLLELRWELWRGDRR